MLALDGEGQETELALIVRLAHRLPELVDDDDFEPEVAIEVGALHAGLEEGHEGIGNHIEEQVHLKIDQKHLDDLVHSASLSVLRLGR